MKSIRSVMIMAAVMMLVGGSTLAMAAEKEESAPEKGTWQYDYAMETGTLEPVGTGTFKVGNIPQVEETVVIGGMTYRIHIDLP